MRSFEWKKIPDAAFKKAFIFQKLNPEQIKIDITTLEEMFEKKEVKISSDEPSSKPTRPTKLSFIEGKRSQGINIFLKKMEGEKFVKKEILDKKKEGVISVLKEVLLQANTEFLTEEIISMFLSNLPKDEEINQIKAWISENPDKDPEKELQLPDLFFLGMSEIPNKEARLICIKFIQNCTNLIRVVNDPLIFMKEATESLRSSEEFPKILEIILMIGDFLNSDNSRLSNFFSFHLEGLGKLKDFRSNFKEKTLLDYLLRIIISQYPSLLNWSDKLKHLKEASLISWEQIETNLNELEKECSTALVAMEKVEVEAPDPFLLVRRKLIEYKKDIDDLVLAKTKVYNDWKLLAEGYGLDSKNITPEGFYKLFQTFADDFKNQLNQQKEEENKESKKKEIEEKRREIDIKKQALERRRMDLANRNKESSSHMALKKKATNSVVEDQKSEKEAETILSNVIDSLVTNNNKRKLRKKQTLGRLGCVT